MSAVDGETTLINYGYMRRATKAVAIILEGLLRPYFRLFEVTLRLIDETFGVGISVAFDSSVKRPIDARIAKIDEARANLEDALGALGDLAVEADRNRAELASALTSLRATRAAHATEAEQLAQIKNIAQSDVEAFRKLAGIAPMRERVIGFIAGIVASLVAAGLWQLGALFLLHRGRNG